VIGQRFREALPLTDFPQGVREYQWSPDGSMIAAVVTDRNAERESDSWVFDQQGRYGRLYLIDPASGKQRPVCHGDLHIWEFTWSPDGSAIAAIVTDEPFDWAWYDARLARIDLATGEVTDLYKPDGSQIARPAWSPDGEHIVMATCRWSDPGMSGGDLLLVELETETTTHLAASRSASHYEAHWTPDGRHMLTATMERNRAAICLVGLGGVSETLWSSEQTFTGHAMSISTSRERFAAALSSMTEPADIWVGRAREPSDIDWERLTDTNPSLAEIELPKHRTVRWRASARLAIEGIYVAPIGAVDGPPPMITLVHGGPTGAWSYNFPVTGSGSWIHLLAAKGFAVFLPNPRGSNGYGADFAESNIPDLGGGDWQDIEAGINFCVEQKLADPDRLGIGGWSYGGYMSAWAVTRTQRFKAAVAGATITNWYSFHGTTSIPGFAEQYFGVDPQELATPYAWRSPLFSCDQVRTPTLLLHGERDPVCPVGQAFEFARGLKRRGVTHQCVIYPREGHGFAEAANRRDMTQRALAWFEEHVR
jgi:dipeptidyl aminopeptidase/acylaminoacyl peptidase